MLRLWPNTDKEHRGDLCHHSTFLANSCEIVKDPRQLGLRYTDSCRYSPIKVHDDEKEIDTSWFLRFRAGLNMFNRFPEIGIKYLIKHGYVAGSPTIVACFLLNCVGLSKYKIGCYVANDPSKFSGDVLRSIVEQMYFTNQPLDAALRLFQEHFHLSGKRQHVQWILEVFCDKFLECNPDFFVHFGIKNRTTVLTICCTLLLLNSELHLKPHDEVMTCQEFQELIKGTDTSEEFPNSFLEEMFRRICHSPFQAGWDYTTGLSQLRVFANGSDSPLKLDDYHRRLVYDCKMSRKKSKARKSSMFMMGNSNEVRVLVFNDLLMVARHVKGRNVLEEYRNFRELRYEITRENDKLLSVVFKCKHLETVLLELENNNSKQMELFRYIIEETFKEVTETERLLQEFNLLGEPELLEKNDEIHCHE